MFKKEHNPESTAKLNGPFLWSRTTPPQHFMEIISIVFALSSPQTNTPMQTQTLEGHWATWWIGANVLWNPINPSYHTCALERGLCFWMRHSCCESANSTMLEGGHLKWAVKGVMLAGHPVLLSVRSWRIYLPSTFSFWITQQTATSHIGLRLHGCCWSCQKPTLIIVSKPRRRSDTFTDANHKKPERLSAQSAYFCQSDLNSQDLNWPLSVQLLIT